jgi:hypothetical protein
MISDPQIAPSPPKLLPSLKAGFDATTNHIVLILIPVALDLFLWLGPHLRLQKLIETVVSQLMALEGFQDPGASEMLQAGQEAWMILAERFNLFSILRSYPVGVPSLLASMLSLDTPIGMPIIYELDSIGVVVLVVLAITLLGLIFGTYYFLFVSQAAIYDEIRWRQTHQNLPWTALQVILLALFWIVLFIAVSIPGSCLVSFIALGGLPVGQCALLLYAGVILWLFFPLLFSPHGIFVNHENMFASVKASFRLTRYTLPTTGLFFLMVLLISKGLDLLWQVPPQTSWLTLIGLVGHAFIVTGLLAASFVYYRDAGYWVDHLLQQTNLTSSQDLMSDDNAKT